jgi:hypothetical protein
MSTVMYPSLYMIIMCVPMPHPYCITLDYALCLSAVCPPYSVFA